MKKIILFSLFLAVIMSACYDDYTSDFENTAAYFSAQYPVRTVIMDTETDNFEIQVGATYGGKYSYSGASQTLGFVIADTLITNNSDYTDKGIKLMPASWYSLSNESEISIVDGNVGFVGVTIRKDSLTSHTDATMNTYAIPFLLTTASTDSILEDKNYSIVVVKFRNEFDGRYYVKGVDNTLDVDGSVASKMEYSNDALVLNDYIFLSTTSKNELSVPRVGSYVDGNKYQYNMQFRAVDGSAVLSPIASSDITELAGGAQYDFATKSFVCNYNYKYQGIEHSVVDTLIYSNTEINMESWN